MEVETAALVRCHSTVSPFSIPSERLTEHQVRAAEDILALTRTLKEAWLFGKLATVGASPAEGRAAESARRVAEGLKGMRGEVEGEVKGEDWGNEWFKNGVRFGWIWIVTFQT